MHADNAMTAVIELHSLTKDYGKVKALRGVDLSITPGSIFGFLGPNGAGKSTTIRILMGFIKPTDGTATIFGLDSWNKSSALKSRIGFVPDTIRFGKSFTGRYFLEYTAKLRGIKGTPVFQKQLLDQLEMPEQVLKRKVHTYSSGMAKKIALIQAMQHKPDLMIFDEPTEALDPISRKTLFTAMKELQKEGSTILMSSHILPDVQEICETIALIKNGSIESEGSVDQLRQGKSRNMTVEFETIPDSDPAIPGVTLLSKEGNIWSINIVDNLKGMLQYLTSHNIVDLEYQQLSLEDLFLSAYEIDSEDIKI